MPQDGRRRHLHHYLIIALLAGLLNLAYLSRLPADDFEPTAQTLRQVEQDYGGYARQRVLIWYQLIDNYHDAAPRDKLERVNNFYNQLAFVNHS